MAAHQPHFTLDLNVTTLDLREKKPKNALDNWTFYATKWTTNPPHIWFYFDLHNDEWLYLNGQKQRLPITFLMICIYTIL